MRSGLAATVAILAKLSHSDGEVSAQGLFGGSSKAPISAQAEIPSILVSDGDIFEGRLDDRNALRGDDGTFVSFFSLDLESQELGVFAVDANQPLVITVLARSNRHNGETPGWTKSPQSPATLRLSPGKARYVLVYSVLGTDYRVMVRTARPGTQADFRLAFHRTYTGADDGSGARFLRMTERLVASLDRPNRIAILAPNRASDGAVGVERAALPPRYSLPLDDRGRSYVATKPRPLQPFYASLYADGEHNAVLNFQRLGLAAIEVEAIAEAEWAFDSALDRIEAVFADDDAARKARSVWGREGIKDFKGEAYERAMAFYYRGLLYLKAGDYENARAAFYAAEYQDTISVEAYYQGDFGLMSYLAGWASRCAGDVDRAVELFAIAGDIDPHLSPPGEAANTIFLFETGGAPVKVARGGGGHVLQFARTHEIDVDDQQPPSAIGAHDGTLTDYALFGDLFYQATTRGPRVMDDTHRKQERSRESLRQLPGIDIFGWLVGSAMDTAADIRMWETLPEKIYVATGRIGPDALRAAGTAGAAQMVQTGARCNFVWNKSRTSLLADASVPGSSSRSVTARAKNAESQKRDSAFREYLLGHDFEHDTDR